MANSITYGPSALQVFPQTSMTSGVPSIHFSGTLDSAISAMEFKITLFSNTASTVVNWTDVANLVTDEVNLTWSADITGVPIGPSGSNYNDWYDVFFNFFHTGASVDTIGHLTPWGVGILAWGIGQSNMHFWGRDDNLPGYTVFTGGDGIGLTGTSGISCLSATRNLNGSNPVWAYPDGSGCSYFVSSLHETFQRPVAFVQMANGGSPLFKDHDSLSNYQALDRKAIGKWGYWLDTNGHLWKDLVTCYNYAGKPNFVVTHQGEADAAFYNAYGHNVTPDEYKAGFEVLIQRIRNLVGDNKLPFAIGQLHGYYTNDAGAFLGFYESYSNVMRGQRLITEDDPYSYLVTLHDCDRLGDFYHMSPSGFSQFAVRAADVFRYINNEKTSYAGPKITSITPVNSTTFEVNVTHSTEATTWAQASGHVVSGFEVRDSFSDSLIEFNAVDYAELVPPNKVRVHLTRELSGSVKFGYFAWGAMIPLAPLSIVTSSVAIDDAGYPIQQSFDGWVPLDLDKQEINLSKFNGRSHEVSSYAGVLLNAHDAGSTLVEDAIDLYTSSNTFYTNIESAGPLYKFLKALSWSLYDINEFIEDIDKLMDIERCPKEFFAYLAKIIGWHLISNDIDSWRAQLRQAIYVYKMKGTRRALEEALHLIFPGNEFNPTDRVTELWESYLPNLLYYVIKTESPYHLRGWTREDANDLDIPFSRQNPDWNARYCVDFILARIEERNPGFINSIPDFEFGDTFFEYRGRSDNIVPPFEKERYYSTKYVWPEHITYINYHLSSPIDQKGLGLPTSAVDAIWDHFEVAKNQLLQGSNQKWKFFTSAQELPFNYDKVMTDPLARFSNDIHYWSGKSSSVLLELSTGDFDFDLNQFASNSKYAVEAVADILKDFKPFHVVFEFLLYHGMEDEVDIQDLFLGWNLKFNFCENVEDWALAGYHTSASVMVSGLGNLPRGDGNRLPNTSYESSALYIPQIATVPRKSLRRKNRAYTSRECRIFRRDGKSMPIPQDYLSVTSTYGSLNAPLSSTGFLPKGFNPSTGDYFTPVSSHGGIYKPRYGQDETYSGIPLSAGYPCRGLTGIDSIKTITRNNLTPFQLALVKSRQRRADYLSQVSALSANAELASIEIPRGNPWSEGLTFQSLIEDFGFGPDLNRIYNTDYLNIFGRRLVPDFSDPRAIGGLNLESHLLGPTVFNGNLIVAGPQTADSLSGAVYAGNGALGDTYITNQEVEREISQACLEEEVPANNCFSATYAIEGNVTRVESAGHVSGVRLGLAPDSRSFFVNNSLATSSYSVDQTEKSYDRSISIFNRDAANSVKTIPYLQFNLGGGNGLDTTSNVLLPEYEYELDLTMRDSDFRDGSQFAVALFVDDFYGQSYYFDFETQMWKHKTALISINRKDNPIYDTRKIYHKVNVSSGDFEGTKTSKIYDPKNKTVLYSTNIRRHKINFNTKNSDILEPRAVRRFAKSKGGLHSINTQYYLRVVKYSNEGAFISFDDISIRNLTYEKWLNDYYFIAEELLDIYEQFDYDYTNLKSRNAPDTSSTHELSGGSRHVYMEPCSWPDLSGTYQWWTLDLGANSVSASVYEFTDG